MKQILYIIILVFIAVYATYSYVVLSNNLVVRNANIINEWKPTIHIKDNSYIERSIEFVFISSSIVHSIDTFMIVINDGYIYKGIYNEDITINNLSMKSHDSGWGNYTTIGFIGFDNKTSLSYWWQEKQNYNLWEIKKVYVFLFSNGMMCFTTN